MANTGTSTGVELSPVRLSRLARRGILLGLSLAQVITLGAGLVVIVGSLYTAGGAGLWWTFPVWGSTLVLAWLPVGGRSVIEWAPVATNWAWRVTTGQTAYRRRVMRPRPAGTLALPGDAAAFREYTDPDTGTVMVHDPHHQRLIAVVEVSHPAFVLLDPAEQERRVHGWSRVLATCCRSNQVARLQVLERTVPDSGSGLARWWADHGTDDGSWVARTYRELIDQAGPAGERHITTISLALDMAAAGRAIRAAGGGLRGAVAVLRQEMATLSTALRAADLQPSGWYDPGQLAVALRSAYDPAVAATLERSGLGRDLATAGPVAVEETWDRLRSDSAHHAVLWIAEWPRTLVYPGFLGPLVLSSGITRTISLVCDPIRADVAARSIRRRKTEYISDAAQRAKIGQLEDAHHTAEYQDVVQQEADLTAGHGLLRYTGLIAVSAASPADLDAAVSEVEQAAIQASCETRRLVGQQAQAFTAASLPLCRGL